MTNSRASRWVLVLGCLGLAVALSGCLDAVGMGMGTFRPGGPGHFEVRADRTSYVPGETASAIVYFVNDGERDVKSPKLASFEWFLVGNTGVVSHGWVDQEPRESVRVHPRDRTSVGYITVPLYNEDTAEPLPVGQYSLKIQWKTLWGEGRLVVRNSTY